MGNGLSRLTKVGNPLLPAAKCTSTTRPQTVAFSPTCFLASMVVRVRGAAAQWPTRIRHSPNPMIFIFIAFASTF